MYLRSLVNVLILMIAMQSGIVVADIHHFSAEVAVSHELTLSADQHKHLQQTERDTQQTDSGDCDFCVHSHCSHFVALAQFANLSVAHFRDNFFFPYQPGTKADTNSSMYRPPKA
jgi:hypothetical protein